MGCKYFQELIALSLKLILTAKKATAPATKSCGTVKNQKVDRAFSSSAKHTQQRGADPKNIV
ncbi:MAG: hypothetical protein LH628_13265 [Microcoleus sp. CAN_BIN18]|nr:hypothetical protein [Microcoleus sp. CAN_BIN18]